MSGQETGPGFWLKRYLPVSLFGRAILILILPMLIMQGGAIYFFYNEHWVNVQRHLSMSLAGDVAFLTHEFEHADEKRQRELSRLARELLDIEIRREPMDPNLHFPSSSDDDDFAVFARQLHDLITDPFALRRSFTGGENRGVLYIRTHDHILRMQFSIKRLSNVTTETFVWWMIGSALLLVVIAISFLRNQIRPISKLADAAEQFGKGQDSALFRPQGAYEVRRAGYSFIAMRERLKRMISARTEMLAAISHDLRTPLTRMRLALAMLPDQKYVKPLVADVLDMERMIQEYLDFARGDTGEETVSIRLSVLMNDVVATYARLEKNITLQQRADPELNLFYYAMRRCLYNLIDNALKYGTHCVVTVEELIRRVEILIDDDGPGIPPAERERAKQPFKRLDSSRGSDTGGAGLGLSIVQDIVLRHGGEMLLEDSPLGGLRVRVRLPL